MAPTPDAAGLLEALPGVGDQELGRLQVSAWLGKDYGFLVLDGMEMPFAGREMPERFLFRRRRSPAFRIIMRTAACWPRNCRKEDIC